MSNLIPVLEISDCLSRPSQANLSSGLGPEVPGVRWHCRFTGLATSVTLERYAVGQVRIFGLGPCLLMQDSPRVEKKGATRANEIFRYLAASVRHVCAPELRSDEQS